MAFQPGQSGNPGGRPKDSPQTRALKTAAQEHTESALQALVDGLSDPDIKIRMLAANSILDRGHGKPAQSVDVGNKDGEPFRQINEFIDRIVDPRAGGTAGVLAADTSRDVQGR